MQFVLTWVAECMVPFPVPLYGCSRLFHLPKNTVFLSGLAPYTLFRVLLVLCQLQLDVCSLTTYVFWVVIAAPAPGDMKKVNADELIEFGP